MIFTHSLTHTRRQRMGDKCTTHAEPTEARRKTLWRLGLELSSNKIIIIFYVHIAHVFI